MSIFQTETTGTKRALDKVSRQSTPFIGIERPTWAIVGRNPALNCSAIIEPPAKLDILDTGGTDEKQVIATTL